MCQNIWCDVFFTRFTGKNLNRASETFCVCCGCRFICFSRRFMAASNRAPCCGCTSVYSDIFCLVWSHVRGPEIYFNSSRSFPLFWPCEPFLASSLQRSMGFYIRATCLLPPLSFSRFINFAAY